MCALELSYKPNDARDEELNGTLVVGDKSITCHLSPFITFITSIDQYVPLRTMFWRETRLVLAGNRDVDHCIDDDLGIYEPTTTTTTTMIIR